MATSWAGYPAPAVLGAVVVWVSRSREAPPPEVASPLTDDQTRRQVLESARLALLEAIWVLGNNITELLWRGGIGPDRTE